MPTYDNRTPGDRAKLDAALASKLADVGQTRGALAGALLVEPTSHGDRMVSASLRRLVREGKATRGGPRNAPTYKRAGGKRGGR